MKIIDCVQLSPEWFNARRGIPTASNFGRIITPKTGKLSASADELAHELIAELHFLGDLGGLGPAPSRAMVHGTTTEPEARRWYSLERDCDVKQVGFVTTDDGRFGASPDGLIGEGGALELKCPQGKTQVGYLLNGGLPDEYRAQVHGQLLVTGREWVDFLSYCPGLPPLLVRVEPDGYTVKLWAAVVEFWGRYQELLARVQQYGAAEVPA